MDMEIFYTYAPLFVQLAIALLLGMVLGAERTLAHKTAGMRTYGLVSLGACLFIVTGLAVTPSLAPISSLDLMRIVSGIITGVGFIGGGIIIFKDHSDTITGLTTAAGLWIAAGIGVAVGFHQYALAIFATVLTLIVFTVFWYVERGVEKIGNGQE